MSATDHQRVVAVLVCHNGRPFIRDTLRDLTRQSRPIDDLIVVDTGSIDGAREWLRSHIGDQSVITIKGHLGQAVEAALEHPRVQAADWIWILHDDSAPEPEALQYLMAEAEYTPAATVLGPKLVGWDDPERLREVGWWIDRAAYASSPVEDREIDQGQHDSLSEVFFVSTAAMLVRRDALEAVGGFDTRMIGFREDLDLCWRMHLVGGKVLIVPPARVRHFQAATVGSRLGRSLVRQRYLTERHSLAAMLKATAFGRLGAALATAALTTLIRVFGLLFTGRVGEASQVVFAWGWNLKELPATLRLRRQVQARRRVSDQSLGTLRAPGGQRVRGLVRALTDFATTDPGGSHASDPSVWRVLRRTIVGHPVTTATVLFTVVMAVALRSLVFSGEPPAGLPVFPASDRDLFSGFASALGTEGLASDEAASPSLVVLWLTTVLSFGQGLLAQKLVFWFALPLALLTATRALRVLVPDLRARVVAGLLYATTPVATGALAQGRLGELAFLILAPPAMAQVWLAFAADQPREPWRPALRFAILTALCTAFYPPAVVLLALTAVIGLGAVVISAPDRRGESLRQGALLGAALLGALLLLFPWSLALFTGSSPLLTANTPAFSPSFGELLQLTPGGEQPVPYTGLLYPVLAAAALLFAGTVRRGRALWIGVMLLLSVGLVALQSLGLVPSLSDWLGGVMIPVTLLWAGLVGLGITGLLPALSRPRLTLQRVMALTLAATTTMGLLVTATFLVIGAWSFDDPGERLPANVRQGETNVLWLSGRQDGGFQWEVTGPAGRSVVTEARPVSVNSQNALQVVVTDVLQARTHRAGQLLRSFNIGYVAVRQGPNDDRIIDLLARQSDLEIQVSDQAALFEGPPAASAGLVFTGEPPENAAQLAALTDEPQVLEGELLAPRGQVQGPGTVLLPAPVSGAWRAEVEGRELARSEAFGWAQAFTVPAGLIGQAELTYSGQTLRTVLLVIQAVFAFVAFVMLARPTRKPPPPAPIAEGDTGELSLPVSIAGGVR